MAISNPVSLLYRSKMGVKITFIKCQNMKLQCALVRLHKSNGAIDITTKGCVKETACQRGWCMHSSCQVPAVRLELTKCS